jgi:hypothetical protein
MSSCSSNFIHLIWLLNIDIALNFRYKYQTIYWMSEQMGILTEFVRNNKGTVYVRLLEQRMI